MNLRIYLLKNGLSYSKFAKICDLSVHYLRMVAIQEAVPKPKTARIISRATNGIVTVDELTCPVKKLVKHTITIGDECYEKIA